MNTFLDLKRNDIPGAIALYKEGCPPDVSRMLLMLQDDPEELIALMLEADKAKKA